MTRLTKTALLFRTLEKIHIVLLSEFRFRLVIDLTKQCYQFLKLLK